MHNKILITANTSGANTLLPPMCNHKKNWKKQEVPPLSETSFNSWGSTYSQGSSLKMSWAPWKGCIFIFIILSIPSHASLFFNVNIRYTDMFEALRASQTNLQNNKCTLTLDTLPVPVNTNVRGPMDLGMRPKDISYPQSLTAWRAWLTFL